MSFHTVLSPSPLEPAFHGMQFYPMERLDFTDNEKSVLKAAEDNPIDYTLGDQNDAVDYVRLLLKLLDQVIVPNKSSSKISKLTFEVQVSSEEAVKLLHDDPAASLTHYGVSRLYGVIYCLVSSTSKKSKVTLSSTFYPDGILLENWRPLLRALLGGAANDMYVARGTAYCLAHILREGCELQRTGRLFTPVASILESFVSWMTSRLQSSAKGSLAVVTPSLLALLVSPEAREKFDMADGLGYLCRHLRVVGTQPTTAATTSSSAAVSRDGPSVQQLYELTYCLWVLSFDCDTNERLRKHLHRDGAVAALVDLVAMAPREKVVRVALSALRNLASTNPEGIAPPSKPHKSYDGQAFLREMIGCGLLGLINQIKERNWSDPDIVEDLRVLSIMLGESFSDMTRFDVYKSEVESGHLQWGAIHTEAFFKENAKLMEGSDGKFHIVKTLIRLASSGYDEVAAIACFDLGEFVRNYPNGRMIAKSLGARDVVMNLISSSKDPNVQREALKCISKMLIQKWQALG